MAVILWVSCILRVNVNTNHLSVFAMGTNFEYCFIWQSIEWPLHLKIIQLSNVCKKSTQFELSSDFPWENSDLLFPLEKSSQRDFFISQEFTESRGFLPWREQRITLSYGIFFDGVLRCILGCVVAGGFVWFLICGGHRLFSSQLVYLCHMLLSDLFLLWKLPFTTCMAHVLRFIFHFALIHLNQGHFFYMQVEPQQLTWTWKVAVKTIRFFIRITWSSKLLMPRQGKSMKSSHVFLLWTFTCVYQHLPRGANWTLRDGELTHFRNHLAPFGEVQVHRVSSQKFLVFFYMIIAKVIFPNDFDLESLPFFAPRPTNLDASVIELNADYLSWVVPKSHISSFKRKPTKKNTLSWDVFYCGGGRGDLFIVDVTW